MINASFKRIRSRIQEKRVAYARVGSIFAIEKVMSRFLKKFRQQKERRTVNKIKFSTVTWSMMFVEPTELI